MDYGPSALNMPQIFISNFVYHGPWYRDQHGLAGHLLGGWQVSGIVTLESGTSFGTGQYQDPFGCVADDTQANGCAPGTYPGGLGIWDDGPNYDIVPRPDQTGPAHVVKHGLQWFDPGAFTTAVGHFGDSRAGDIVGPGFERVDLGLMKNFRFTEALNLQMRAESFNLFNHTSFAGVDNGLEDGTFGQVVSAHNPRIMQFGAKLTF
jgi:hypothetical protein